MNKPLKLILRILFIPFLPIAFVIILLGVFWFWIVFELFWETENFKLKI